MTGRGPPARNRNELWARVLIDELVRCGVREVVVSPGSRSTPLVLAVAAEPSLRTVVLTDERSAAFLALGVGKATGRPAAVLTTSGTAAANLLPAVVESSQSETPLLVLTADRPPHLRGADANQAIEQAHLYGRYPRFYHEAGPPDMTEAALRHLRAVAARAMAAAVGDPAGPSHLNLPFAKPLEPTPVRGDVPAELAERASLAVRGREAGRPIVRVHPRRAAPTAEAADGLARALGRARRPLLVAGPLPRPWHAGPAVRKLAAQRGIPLLADALSGARYPGAIGSYDTLLRDPATRETLRPDLVVRFGASPTSAALLRWLEELADVHQVVVDGGERWKDHLVVAAEVIRADPERVIEGLEAAADSEGPDRDWLARWERLEAGARAPLAEAGVAGEFEAGVVGRIGRAVPSGDLLFVSSSMPVRDVDAFLPHRDEPLTVLGNRGASGIDGIVSTAAGAALGTGRRVVAVVGDLAFLHDAGGLAALREAGVRVLLVVVNNDGGGIFHLLPVREHEPEFTRFFATPHGRNLSRLAALHDLPHRAVDLRGEGRGATDGAVPDGPATEAAGTDRADGASDAVDLDALASGLDWAFDLDESGILEIRTDRETNRTRRERAIERAGEAARRALAPEAGASRFPSGPG